jgi:S-adenosylmethionine:tRNA-ribosyltransferase-isomerase (queuine synthetase)
MTHITWFPDTTATQHVTPDIVDMTHAKPSRGNDQIYVSDGKRLIISNTAHKILHTPKRTLICLIFYMFHKLSKDSYLFNNFIVKIMSFLSFTLLFSMSRIS